VSEDTGRIRRLLDPRARRVVFGGDAERAVREELGFYLQVDRAHLVMLAERGLLSPTAAQVLLGVMNELSATGGAALRERPAPRGLYLLYEGYLAERLGDEAGGALHLGRSRNDLNATVLRLRLRAHHDRLCREVLRLVAVLVHRAERHAGVVMPIYTHYQAALPITYGHYLAGVAAALLRDARGLVDAAREMESSPLGAGAAGGTTVPIDPERTARLLGFARTVPHSVDAVASRDLVLRVLAAAAVLGVTLSRLAADLQLWSTAEFDFVRFPDWLVGSSSMMPQKRNAFLLEHVRGRAGAPLGAFTAAAAAMQGTPFTNSIAVGTEGVSPLWSALDGTAEAALLARLCVAGAHPQPEPMLRRAELGFTTATELANQLVREAGLSFRRAHYRVGEAVAAAAESGEPLAAHAALLLDELGMPGQGAAVSPAAVAASAEYGGGPAPASFRRIAAGVRAEWAELARALRERRLRWAEGARAVDAAARSLAPAADAGGPHAASNPSG
jgi:argininosuccinate lyase